MTNAAARSPRLTRRRLLFGLGSATGVGAISPALAATALATPPTGSENRISQIELDRIVARHQLWLDRKTGGALANFSGRDLSGLKFGRWDLRHATFAGANLSGIHATDTRFCYCDFTAADLSAARTYDCDFRYTRFKRAQLIGAQILDTLDNWPPPVGDEEPWYCGGGLMDASLEEANLRYARINVQVTDAWFGNADLRNADLRAAYGPARFYQADLRDAALDNASLLESDFEEALLSNSIPIEIAISTTRFSSGPA